MLEARVAGKRTDRNPDVMRTVLLCGVPSSETHWLVILDQFLLRIKEPDVSDAISLSVALKRPERSVGGITGNTVCRDAS